MQAQGIAVVNTGFFDEVAAHINGIAAQASQEFKLIETTFGDAAAQIEAVTAKVAEIEAELQGVVTRAMASIQAEVSAIEAQAAALLPLITMPHDLGSVISWITNFATPMIKPYLNYTAQLSQTLAAIASLQSAIRNAVVSINFAIPGLSVSVSISLPTII